MLSLADKLRAVRALGSQAAEEVADAWGVSVRTLYRWKAKLKDELGDGTSSPSAPTDTQPVSRVTRFAPVAHEVPASPAASGVTPTDTQTVTADTSDDTFPPEVEEALGVLSRRERRFVLTYCNEGCNGARTARLLGMGNTDASHRTLASRMLMKVDVKAAVDAVLRSLAPSPQEITARLHHWAKGSADDLVDEEGRIDLADAKRRGALTRATSITVHRSVKERPDGTVTEDERVSIKLGDPLKAAELLGRHNAMFRDRVEHSGAMELNADDLLGLDAKAEAEAKAQLAAEAAATKAHEGGEVEP